MVFYLLITVLHVLKFKVTDKDLIPCLGRKLVLFFAYDE